MNLFGIFGNKKNRAGRPSRGGSALDGAASNGPSASPEGIAIRRSHMVIEFTIDGTITDANENFLNAMGYSYDQVVGRRHSMFMHPDEATSAEYDNFWKRLANGEYFSAEFRRFDSRGRELWIQGSYNPILDKDGTPVKVIKFALDITDKKMKHADDIGQIKAISNSQAVITFSLDGHVQSANDIFCRTVGYDEGEIVGKHHRIFVQPSEQKSAAYRQFWQSLARGKLQAGEFCRIGRNGKVVWLQATYTPILDPAGRPFKVVKYASDITEAKLRSLQFDAKLRVIGVSTAVAEWGLGGACQDVNAFLASCPRMDLPSLVPQAEIDRICRGEQVRCEIEWPRASGPSMWLDAMFSRVTDLEGRPERILMCAVDVTPRRLAIASASTAMQDMLGRMRKIVGNLEQITRTTNMLALNAAVQAGRAGEAGKGFAVVATEVRVLAGQSENAVAEINGLIGEGRMQVERLGGMELSATPDTGLDSAACRVRAA